MAGTHGGARPGAGRKPNAEVHAESVGGFTLSAAEYLPQAFENLRLLAEGGALRVEQKWSPAGTLTRKDVARDDAGAPLFDKNGKLSIIEVPLYPDLPAEEPVMVERKVTTLPPDYKANEYLVDRVAGKTAPAPDPDPEGLSLVEALDLAEADVAGYVEPDEAARAAPLQADDE